VVCSKNVSVLHRFPYISTFVEYVTVTVTACDLETTFSIDMTVTITDHPRFLLIRTWIQPVWHLLHILNAVRCPYATYVRNVGRGQLSSEWRHNDNCWLTEIMAIGDRTVATCRNALVCYICLHTVFRKVSDSWTDLHYWCHTRHVSLRSQVCLHFVPLPI